MAPGLAYAVSKKFHLELGLNDLMVISYAKTKTETSDLGGAKTINGHAFGASTSVGTATPIYLGFQVLLAK